MKVSDAIAQFLAQQGIGHVFTVSGGADLHIIDSIARTEGIRYVCTTNEQAASFAADAYCRLNSLGVALATSGPGATNLLTGVATSFYDSVPVLYLTGNQTRARMDGMGTRQYGFQATPIAQIAQPIVKVAYTVNEPRAILYTLAQALRIARQGRPGPVLVDIPDDVQRADCDDFIPYPHDINQGEFIPAHGDVSATVKRIVCAKRPLFVFGAGMRAAAKEAAEMIAAAGIPCVTTWGAADALGTSPWWIGSFGTHGVRAANFAVQTADLLICIGTRLDTKATGSPASSFAAGAQIVMVDTDPAELDKMEKIGRKVIPICCGARLFIIYLAAALANQRGYADALAGSDDTTHSPAWWERIQGWRARYDPVLPSYGPGNPYAVLRALSAHLRPDDVIVSDTGCALAWAHQALAWGGQRFVHAHNQTPMGYGLPAAIGAAFATGRRVVLLTGDGGLQVSVGELATVAKHRLPIKILLFDNKGHAMCRQTQRQWLEGRYCATGAEDLPLADLEWVAGAFGLSTPWTLDLLMAGERPALLKLNVDPEQGVEPQIKFGEPLANLEEINEQA